MYDIYGNNNHPVYIQGDYRFTKFMVIIITLYIYIYIYIQGDYRFTKFVVDGALELGDHKITNNTVSVLSG